MDNPLFHVAKQGETVKPGRDHKIVVGFDGSDSRGGGGARSGSAGGGGGGAPVMGKLTVSCAKSAGGATAAQWVYYLKGVTPEGK